jgi:isopenicillin N synthase-like dioxygenase
MTGVSKPLANPSCIEASRSDLKAYMEQAHEVIELICNHLELHLRLPKDSLANLQPLSLSSGTSLRMLRCLPQPQDDLRTSIVGHTDIGSMTLLFNALGGLQILPPDMDGTEDSSWVYVQPQPGCAIINLGDAMVEWSAGILRSNMHRVIYGPGKQSKVTRYSLAYLLRPFSDAPMKRLSGGKSLVPPIGDDEEENLMTSREWEGHRAAAIRAGKDNARSRGGRKIIIPAESAITAGSNSATAINTISV